MSAATKDRVPVAKGPRGQGEEKSAPPAASPDGSSLGPSAPRSLGLCDQAETERQLAALLGFDADAVRRLWRSARARGDFPPPRPPATAANDGPLGYLRHLLQRQAVRYGLGDLRPWPQPAAGPPPPEDARRAQERERRTVAQGFEQVRRRQALDREYAEKWPAEMPLPDDVRAALDAPTDARVQKILDELHDKALAAAQAEAPREMQRATGYGPQI